MSGTRGSSSLGKQQKDPRAVEAGLIGRAHGLDGSFYVRRAVPAALKVGASVRFGDRETKITRRAGTDAKLILRLEGVDTREAEFPGDQHFIPHRRKRHR